MIIKKNEKDEGRSVKLVTFNNSKDLLNTRYRHHGLILMGSESDGCTSPIKFRNMVASIVCLLQDRLNH